MSGAVDLHDVQMLIWRLITAPEGVAPGAAALRREGALSDPTLRSLLRPSASQSAVERLDVYADMYFYRLRDCLAEDYPNLARWLGPQRFHNLVTDYLLAHPSRHPSLRELGRALPAFLASTPPGEAFARASGLATLEWARVDVFDEADAAPLGRDALLARAGADPEGCRVALVPALRLLRLEGGVLALWRALEDGHEAPAAGPAPPATACVWRRDFAVLHRSVDADEARCLGALERRPRSLAELGERVLAARDDGLDARLAGQRLGALLDRWTADGLLRAADG